MNDHKKPKVAIVIPVFNEETVITSTLERIRKTIAEIPGYDFEIICVNDGSTDGTTTSLKNEVGIKVLSHLVNRGYGASLRTGIEHTEAEWIFIIDADDTYPIEDMPRLFALADPDTDMVVGARKGIGISNNPFRHIARWVLRKMVHALSGTMVPDLNSGMRLFKKSLYREFCHLLPDGFSFTSTITVASLYGGHSVKYIPIEYGFRKGTSNIKPFKDFLGFSMLIIRLASYFEPLRFFLITAFLFFFMGFVRGTSDFIRTGAIGNLPVILFVIAFNFFVAGIILDVVVRRTWSNK